MPGRFSQCPKVAHFGFLDSYIASVLDMSITNTAKLIFQEIMVLYLRHATVTSHASLSPMMPNTVHYAGQMALALTWHMKHSSMKISASKKDWLCHQTIPGTSLQGITWIKKADLV